MQSPKASWCDVAGPANTSLNLDDVPEPKCFSTLLYSLAAKELNILPALSSHASCPSFCSVACLHSRRDVILCHHDHSPLGRRILPGRRGKRTRIPHFAGLCSERLKMLQALGISKKSKVPLPQFLNERVSCGSQVNGRTSLQALVTSCI